MGTSKRREYSAVKLRTLTRPLPKERRAGGTDSIHPHLPTRRDSDSLLRLTLVAGLMLSLLLSIPPNSSGATKADKRKGRSIDGAASHQLTRGEVAAAEGRLAEMGYGTGRVNGVIDDAGRNALIAFQKWEGRKVTGSMSREDFDLIMNATAPMPKDPGYKHVEVDLDRQVL